MQGYGNQIMGDAKLAKYSAREGGIAGGIGAACEQTRQAEIPHQMERLGRTLEGCMKGLEVLAMKLESSVMRGEAPTPQDAIKEPTSIAITPIGARLQDCVSMAANINARIESLTARLEV